MIYILVAIWSCLLGFLVYLALAMRCLSRNKHVCILCKYFTLLECAVISRIRRGFVVVIIDYKDHIIYSVAVPIQDSEDLQSWYSPSTRVGPVILREDGSITDPDGSDTFLYNWLPVNVEQRTWKVLQGARNFDF